MRNVMHAFLVIAGLGLSGQALAECVTTADGTSLCGPEPVQKLYVSANGAIYVSPTSSLAALPPRFSCTPISGSYFMLDPHATNYKQLYASLLSAHMAGAPVTFVLDPTKAQCTIAYIIL